MYFLTSYQDRPQSFLQLELDKFGIVSIKGKNAYQLREINMFKYLNLFTLAISLGFFNQPATAQMNGSMMSGTMKCHIQVEPSEAAEKQLGGALYSGPMLSPDEIMTTMKKAHLVHHPQQGGAFFMAPNKMNHLEVIYSDGCGARVYMYNAFTMPIKVDRLQAFVEFVPLDDDEVEVIRFLQPSKDSSYMGTGANHGVKSPFDIRLFVKFPESDQVELFSVKLKPTQTQFVEGNGIVVEIDLAAGKLVINQQAIPGYMGAMTMPYTVSDSDLLDQIKPGMEIKFIIDRTKNIIVKIEPIMG
jgi:Cu/Ag efflux protein CusF